MTSNSLDSGLFRRDQVWFLEKDRDGATDLYPLSDYKTRGKVALQKGYLVGRYGAIPFMGVLSFDQETAEEVDQATAETDQTPVRRETAAQSSSGCVRW